MCVMQKLYKNDQLMSEKYSTNFSLHVSECVCVCVCVCVGGGGGGRLNMP